MRVCHLDTCPVGVATQNPVLRKRFTGQPEFVENFFWFIADEVREYLAALGFRSINDAVGHVDALDTTLARAHWKAHKLDLTPLLHQPESAFMNQDLYCTSRQDHGLDKALDQQLIVICREALDMGTPVRYTTTISNVNRTVGTMLGHEVTKAYGAQGLPDGTIDITFTGSAGNSFGAFLPNGITLRVHGDANDYLGKGLSGGRIVVRPPDGVPDGYRAQDNIITGNVALFGATSGQAFLAGIAGERFAVRNSGAHAVVEGVGDHGCEYMTGGKIVILGPTGRNFAAGMSGGIAYLYDPHNDLPANLNTDMVDLDNLDAPDLTWLHTILHTHRDATASALAHHILTNWPTSQHHFAKVMPQDYKAVLQAITNAQTAGTDPNHAIMETAHG
jgi:glutamate synthase (NADPH/NADH) large chain